MDLGAIYISGRLDKLGHQPVLNIDMKKLRDVELEMIEEIITI